MEGPGGPLVFVPCEQGAESFVCCAAAAQPLPGQRQGCAGHRKTSLHLGEDVSPMAHLQSHQASVGTGFLHVAVQLPHPRRLQGLEGDSRREEMGSRVSWLPTPRHCPYPAISI